MFKFDRKRCPAKPGVYQYKDSFGEIIYIGKAKNLKNRVSSYFSSKHENSVKTQFLVKNIADVEYIVVDNEVEALLLENKLVKKHKPKYNIDLKDSKTFAYIKITDDEIPRIETVRKVSDKGDYFGPFTDGYLRMELFELTVGIFGLITKKTYSTKSKLNYEIGKAPAATIDEIDIEKYLIQVKEAKEFLKGKNTARIKKRLLDEMHEAKDDNRFEEALIKKKQIEAIMHMKERQKVDLVKNYDQDVIAMIKTSNEKALIVLFNISRGVLSGKKEFRLDYTEDLFESFVKMYYSQNYLPKELLVNKEFWEDESEKEVLEEYLTKIKNAKVNLVKPSRGEKLSLVKLAEENAKLNLKENKILIEIRDKLNLPKTPRIIECFDMSNLSYDFLVGGMTRWVNGKPDKQGYRKFEIKSFSGKNDDFRSMQEVTYRRYRRLKEEGKQMPDLIIVDGGKGQLSAGMESLRRLKLDIPIIGLAKKEEEIFLPNRENSLRFKKNSEMMLFIRNVRNSVHNFVISYNRKKREMKLKKEFKKD